MPNIGLGILGILIYTLNTKITETMANHMLNVGDGRVLRLAHEGGAGFYINQIILYQLVYIFITTALLALGIYLLKISKYQTGSLKVAKILNWVSVLITITMITFYLYDHYALSLGFSSREPLLNDYIKQTTWYYYTMQVSLWMAGVVAVSMITFPSAKPLPLGQSIVEPVDRDEYRKAKIKKMDSTVLDLFDKAISKSGKYFKRDDSK